MLFAYLNGDIRVSPEEYKDEMKGNILCALGHPVIVKRGEKMRHHFSHIAGGCHCTGDMSDWHNYHQGRIIPECLEIRMNRDGKRHIADAVVNGVVIEYQHSPISKTTIVERESFYGNMIWVFDCEKLSIHISKTHKDLIQFAVISGGTYMFDTEKPTFLDMGHRYYIEIIHKKKKKFYGRYISFSDFDKRYLVGHLRDKCDKRVDRPKIEISEIATPDDIKLFCK